MYINKELSQILLNLNISDWHPHIVNWRMEGRQIVPQIRLTDAEQFLEEVYGIIYSINCGRTCGDFNLMFWDISNGFPRTLEDLCCNVKGNHKEAKEKTLAIALRYVLSR